jgi:hypothetical protein
MYITIAKGKISYNEITYDYILKMKKRNKRKFILSINSGGYKYKLKIYNMVGTRDIFYNPMVFLNNEIDILGKIYKDIHDEPKYIDFGKSALITFNDDTEQGIISNFKIHNRALSAEEIKG